MERAFPALDDALGYANQILDDVGRDPRAARDVAAGEPWVFVQHRTLAEILDAERRQ